MASSLENIFGDSGAEAAKPISTVDLAKKKPKASLQNIFADQAKQPSAPIVKPTGKEIFSTPAKPASPVSSFSTTKATPQSTEQTANTRDEVSYDKAASVVGKIAKGVGDFLNAQRKKGEEVTFKNKEFATGKYLQQGGSILEGKTEEEKRKILEEDAANNPVVKFLNTDTGKKITGTVAGSTSNIPLKTVAAFKALGDDTYDEAKAALMAKRNDPNNPRWEKILYGVQDSGVQSAIGALLAVGTSYLTKNPNVGRAVSLAYFAPISAEGQRQEKGSVKDLGNIAIDTVGDTILSGFAEAALKNIVKEGGEAAVKEFLKQTGKGFAVEGSTEVSQTLLKYANDYRNANTDEEKQKAVAGLSAYVKDGGLVDEFLVGGLSGGIITGGASAIGQSGNQNVEVQSEEGRSKVEGKLNTDFSKVRDEAARLEAALRENPTDQDAASLGELQDALKDYQQAVKERAVYVSDDTQDAPLAVIETVRYPDGKFAVRFDTDIGSDAFSSTFSNSQTFESQEKAIAAAKDEITAWVDSSLKKASAEETAKLNEIKARLDEGAQPKMTPPKAQEQAAALPASEKQAKTQEKPLQAATAPREAAPIVRGKDGAYNVVQYSQKGENQGRLKVFFRRSIRNGKTYLEAYKGGERVARMSLTEARNRFQETNRGVLAQYLINGVKNAESGQYDLRQSNAPVIKNTSQQQVENKPVRTKGEVRKSKAFERVRDQLGAYAEADVNYNRLNLAQDTANAMEFVEANPKDAKKIALGLMGAPEGVTETAISIALAEKAADAKDYGLAAQLERSRSLRQTRRGQEIVAERGRFNENSPVYFLQQVLQARLDNAGKESRVRFLSKEGQTKRQSAQAKIQENAEAAKTAVKKRLSAVDLAQNIIDELTC